MEVVSGLESLVVPVTEADSGEKRISKNQKDASQILLKYFVA